jgi:hypothetical protein
MKTLLFKSALGLVMSLGLVFLGSCEKDTPGGGGENDPKQAECSAYGTFTSIICGAGIYESYWIRLDDGTFLQPCETDVQTICPLPITEGTRVKFGYKKITGASACDNIVTCAAVDDRVKSSVKVRITCLQIVNQPTDCIFEGTVMYDQSCNVKYITNTSNNVSYQPMNQDIMAGFAAGQRIQFGYTPVVTLDVPCTGHMGIQVTCATVKDGQPSECANQGTVKYDANCKLKYISNATDKQYYEPVNQEMLNGYQVGQTISFNYNIVETFAVTCTGHPAVQLTCIGNGKPKQTDCKQMIIDANPNRSAGIHILNAVVEDQCLKLKIGFSGCDASTDRIALAWDGHVGPAVTLTLIDKQPQACQAYFTQDVSFNLAALGAADHRNVNITLPGWQGSLVY